MNGTVTTDQVGHTLRVLVDGEVVKTFDEISDDYAFTNRNSYEQALRNALPLCATLEDARNKAWHDM
jgi:hypothetical protein